MNTFSPVLQNVSFLVIQERATDSGKGDSSVGREWVDSDSGSCTSGKELCECPIAYCNT